MTFDIGKASSFVFLSLVASLILSLSMLAQPRSTAAANFFESSNLVGTVWLAPEAHDRTTIDRNGKSSVKTGKNIYIEFLGDKSGVFTIKIHWWNVEANINVVEYAVMVHEAENFYHYVEAEHPDDSNFPGIAASGTFRLINESEAELTQIGRLLDGSASAFVTRLNLVDAAPDVPLKQTYPKMK
ncbi:hypothetical protein [uncultured Sneathiella sp.]|uniref:hypothetical protein n=1 Tax=uncultured Sneathiella sp. TaxID=879315 RepID=UPI0030D953E6|tara:strand:- start:308 stop:862 length:555 start_codon:yes stop_codon:yes gene_type:complete